MEAATVGEGGLNEVDDAVVDVMLRIDDGTCTPSICTCFLTVPETNKDEVNDNDMISRV